jgi:hypothetical protein
LLCRLQPKRRGFLGVRPQGAQQGGEAAGPRCAAVGGVVGGVAGGVAGLLGADQRPRFRDYVTREHRSAYRLDEILLVDPVTREILDVID